VCLLLFTSWSVWRLCIFLFSYELIVKFGSGFILCYLFLEITSSAFIERMLSNIESFVKEMIMLILKVLMTGDNFSCHPEPLRGSPNLLYHWTGPFPGDKAAGEWC